MSLEIGKTTLQRLSAKRHDNICCLTTVIIFNEIGPRIFVYYLLARDIKAEIVRLNWSNGLATTHDVHMNVKLIVASKSLTTLQSHSRPRTSLAQFLTLVHLHFPARLLPQSYHHCKIVATFQIYLSSVRHWRVRHQRTLDARL